MTRTSNSNQPHVILLAAAFVAVVAWASYQWGYRDAERVYQAELDRVTLRELVMAVESIRARLGRAPRDQAELESLLGRALPNVHDEGRPTPVHYGRTGENGF